MNKICTSLEQSKKLLELGINANTADMEYMFLKRDNSIVSRVPFIKDGYEEPDCSYNMVPCWSLTGLLRILPSASLDSSDDHYFRLYCMEKFSEWYDNPIDAVFEMIIRLKENEKI